LKTGQARAPLKDIVSKNQEKSTRLLNESRSVMTKLRVDESCIETVTRPVVTETATGILDYGKQSFCEAIVLGRRGINNSFFMASVSRHVMTNASDCAVWLVS
jgi:hypothetical protein